MIYQFNDFQLDPSNFSLQKIGKSIAIEPQVFNLIIYLIENRTRLVTRDEIFESLWNNRDVLDATLSNHIKLARSILGDDGKSQNIIKTVRGRGYQFIAEVSKIDASSPSTTALVQSKPRKTAIVTLIIFTILTLSWFIYNKHQQQVLFESVKRISDLQKVTYTAFVAQAERRNELVEMINSRLGVTRKMQFEKYFSHYYPNMNNQELFVFQQIRSITDSGLYKSNLLIVQELDSDPRILEEIEYTKELKQHLIFWNNKYENIFKNREDMCLLYVGVEDNLPYPENVNININKWLEENTN